MDKKLMVIILNFLIAITKTCAQILVDVGRSKNTLIYAQTDEKICDKAREFLDDLLDEIKNEEEENGCTTESN